MGGPRVLRCECLSDYVAERCEPCKGHGASVQQRTDPPGHATLGGLQVSRSGRRKCTEAIPAAKVRRYACCVWGPLTVGGYCGAVWAASVPWSLCAVPARLSVVSQAR